MVVETEKNKPNVAEILQQLIDRRKIRPSDLAAQTGLPHNTIYMILGGKVNVPNGLTLLAFADYFNVSVDYLLGRERILQDDTDSLENAVRGLILIPIILWSHISEWVDHRNWGQIKQPWGKQDRRYIEYTGKGSTGSFALEVNKLYLQSVFPGNSLIIVNPKSKIHDGDYVLIKDEEDLIEVWQIKDFNRKRYIQAIGIKTDSVELTPSLTVLGKIVENRKYYV